MHGPAISDAAAAAALDGAVQPPAAPIPVLLVDDRPENLTALRALLAAMPLRLQLVEAGSGNDALRLALKHEFALILLDVQMPGMNGLETAALLRANPRTRAWPIIFVTAGLDGRNHAFEGYESGAVDYLIKPIDPMALRSKVRVFCELYAQRREIDFRKEHLESMVTARTEQLRNLSASLADEILERKHAEHELQRLNAELEQRVEERGAELRRAMDQIVESEKLASLGGIVAGVAHELNTPIGNTLLMATALEERVAQLQELVRQNRLTRSALAAFVDECADACRVIARGAERANTLIASFKNLAVDQASQRRREFALAELVADTFNTFGTVLRHSNVTSEVRVPEQLRMNGHPGDLEQVLANLINNSIRHGFAERGGGHITVQARADGAMLELVYEDDGVGIAPELHRKVFEPFYTTKLGQGGSGLGMFIVHNLVHGQLKGEIRLDSDAGRGMRVILTMPADTP